MNQSPTFSEKQAPSKKTKLPQRTLGPVPDLEKHLPKDWWRTLFNSLYLKTDGDVVENTLNTQYDIDLLLETTGLSVNDKILDLCCGQGRHTLELAKRGFHSAMGFDRSRYLIRLARKRNKQLNLTASFHEGDARSLKWPEQSFDCVCIFGNSFGYFEHAEDDVTVLKSVQHILRSQGHLVLDIVDGTWMKQNFEPRSWEWIDQNYFVNRERSLSQDGHKIISREVITHAEKGVIADQFYAERLYSEQEIQQVLEELNFTDVVFHKQITSHSTRNQDLGMMAHRLFLTAKAPAKQAPRKKQSTQMNVTVLMGDSTLPDSVKKNGQFNEEDFKTIDTLKTTLQQIPHYSFKYLNQHSTLIHSLQKNPPALVLNLCDEGFHNLATQELHVPALLELLNIPYTGAGPVCLGLCYDKSYVRSIAQSMNIPVPMETFYDPDDQAANLPSIFPAILKPNQGDSSIGITQNAVVHNAQELIRHLEFIKDILPGTPILIQEFLAGKEYSVGIVGNPGKFTPLPVLEVDYSHLPGDLPPILSYESKWIPDSPYWTQIKYKEADLDEVNYRNLIDYSLLLFNRMGCRDYARFDYRADNKGVIKLLEVNPNPGWCWDGKLNFMAEFAQISYRDLLEMILQAARDRLNL